MAEVIQETGHRAAAANPDVDYERRDLPLGALAIAALSVAAFVALTPFVMLLCFPQTLGDVDRGLRVLPPAPRLQVNPRQDLTDYLRREQTLLGGYGWIDRAHGITHVPVTVAMQRVVAAGAEGFPRPAQAPAPASASASPGDTP